MTSFTTSAKILISTILSLQLLNSGCVNKELVALSIELADVQEETSDSLANAIRADMAHLTNPDQIKKAQDLLNRLDYLKRGNNALSKGLTKPLTSQELAALIKEYSKIKPEPLLKEAK